MPNISATQLGFLTGATLFAYLYGKRAVPEVLLDPQEEKIRKHIYNESGVQHSQYYTHAERAQLAAKPQGVNTYYPNLYSGDSESFKTQYLNARLAEKPRSVDVEKPTRSLYFMQASHPGANPNRNPFNYRN